eukprot:TRINITY_DN49166_c0_g1_i1.p1 TRINITY_DN49166_c0_g1~~TRINITY_DN49166_c0_g1_i1.p1  ORF type:complete len:147 (-),score=16.87 TRINITY_DN49166_c0_g1_i1:305-745(-)
MGAGASSPKGGVDVLVAAGSLRDGDKGFEKFRGEGLQGFYDTTMKIQARMDVHERYSSAYHFRDLGALGYDVHHLMQRPLTRGTVQSFYEESDKSDKAHRAAEARYEEKMRRKALEQSLDKRHRHRRPKSAQARLQRPESPSSGRP